MANSFPSRQPPHVQHNFDGAVQVLNSTFDRRQEIRRDLTALQQDLMKMENRPTQIKAEIKLRIGGNEAKEHSYTVTITSSDFDFEDFLCQVPDSDESASHRATIATQGASNSPVNSQTVNGQQATPAQSTPRPESRKSAGDDDIIEIRPFKRPRTDRDTNSPSVAQHKDTNSAPKDANSGSNQPNHGGNEVLSFMKKWHTEWVRQGGWLFDNITKTNTAVNDAKTVLGQRLDIVQDVLGQSMNTANASTMTELANMAKLAPWLEQCRKTSADKVQAREEKWRSSSATFHDQARRDREAAEKRIEKRLEEQRELLLKVARASGIDMDEIEAIDAGSPGTSDKSLGAQLTAELNLEAERGSASRLDAENDTINIDDD